MSKNKTIFKDQSQKEVYVSIYNKKQHDIDEQVFTNGLNDKKINWSSFARLMTHDLCVNTQILNDQTIGNIRLKDVKMAFDHPEIHWRILLQLSDELMHKSPHYYRLNTVYSNMARFCWWLDLYGVFSDVDVNQLKKVYGNLADKFENMNIEHEFTKIMKVIPYKDCYCGLIVEDKNSFYFREVPFQAYRIREIEDGLYNFSIKLSAINPKYINAYPDYVQKEWFKYYEGKGKKENDIRISEWYTPPSDRQICLKLNTQWTNPYPLLIALIKDILDLDIYKKLKLQSARTDNYKAILIKVPIDEKAVDKPLLTPETLGEFAEINRENMSDDIALIHTLGSTGEAISFKDSSNTRNNVSDAVDEIYNSAGETKEFFNGSASGTAVMISVENTSGFVYGIYRQIERWANRYIKLKKFNKAKFKFKFKLLDITIFNNDTVIKRYKDSSSLGIGIERYLASLGLTPSVTMGSFIMSNKVFDFANNFTPLKSTYTQSSSDDVGRPTNTSKGESLTEEGEKTADGEKNDR